MQISRAIQMAAAHEMALIHRKYELPLDSTKFSPWINLNSAKPEDIRYLFVEMFGCPLKAAEVFLYQRGQSHFRSWGDFHARTMCFSNASPRFLLMFAQDLDKYLIRDTLEERDAGPSIFKRRREAIESILCLYSTSSPLDRRYTDLCDLAISEPRKAATSNMFRMTIHDIRANICKTSVFVTKVHTDHGLVLEPKDKSEMPTGSSSSSAPAPKQQTQTRRGGRPKAKAKSHESKAKPHEASQAAASSTGWDMASVVASELANEAAKAKARAREALATSELSVPKGKSKSRGSIVANDLQRRAQSHHENVQPMHSLSEAEYRSLLNERDLGIFSDGPSQINAVADRLPIGEIWVDTGCRKGVIGAIANQALQKHYADRGLKPEKDTSRIGHFDFGNGQPTTSKVTYWYPVFVANNYLGDMPLAEIPGVCPALFSQQMLIDWKVVVDGSRKEVRGEANGKPWYVPFKRDGTLYIPLCHVPKDFDPSKRVPPKFRLQ